ncbi:MAG: Na+/H+ antiporter subunit B [Pirellulales bacterium]
MNSLILSTAARLLLPLLLIFSVFLLLRGHYEPGGGFVGGLTAAAAFLLCLFAFGLPEARRILWISPLSWIAAGLTLALTAGLLPMLFRKPFLTGLWPEWDLPIVGNLGRPLLFDMGVYAVVVGVVTLIVFELAEE